MSESWRSGVAARSLGLAEPVVAIVLHQPLDHLLRQQQPLAATAGAPLGEVLADALQRIAAVGGVAYFEAHAPGRLVEHRRAFFDLLADLGAAGIAHAGAYDVVERQRILVEPRRVDVVIASFLGSFRSAATFRQAARSLNHGYVLFCCVSRSGGLG